MNDDTIPASTSYRGVPIHDDQPGERVERIIKPEIDQVYELTDVEVLFDWAADIRHSPESRLFAAAKCEAAWQLAAETRRLRPDVNLPRLRACTAGLDKLSWRDPWHFCSLFDHGGAPPNYQGVPRREPPLID